MSDKTPIISIVTPTFNRANELKYLYKSLQQQSVDFGLLEFIISDDGSTDTTQLMVQKYHP